MMGDFLWGLDRPRLCGFDYFQSNIAIDTNGQLLWIRTRSNRTPVSMTIRELARAIIHSAPIVGGLAILEDHRHETAALEIVPREQIEGREEHLLERARNLT